MRKPMPKVGEHMTKAPHTVEASVPLLTAQKMMREYRVRHLPVQENGKLIGVLSERNVTAALLSSKHADSYMARNAMITDPYVVNADDELSLVVAEMAEEKYGCTIVKGDGDEIVGVFTTTDVCRVLYRLLETVYPE